MLNKLLFTLFVFALGINLYCQTTNDTIYLYQDIEVYDTIFVYDTIWQRTNIEKLNSLKPKQASIKNASYLNNTASYLHKSNIKTATLHKNNIILYDNSNEEDMKKLGFFALTLAALNGFGQEIGIKYTNSYFGDYSTWQSAEWTKSKDNWVDLSNKETLNISFSSFSIELTSKPHHKFSINGGVGISLLSHPYCVQNAGNWNNILEDNNSTLVIVKETYLTIPISIQYNLFWTFNISAGIANNFLVNQSIKDIPWIDNSKYYQPCGQIGFNITLLEYFEFGTSIASPIRSPRNKFGSGNIVAHSLLYPDINFQAHFAFKIPIENLIPKKRDEIHAEPVQVKQY